MNHELMQHFGIRTNFITGLSGLIFVFHHCLIGSITYTSMTFLYSSISPKKLIKNIIQEFS